MNSVNLIGRLTDAPQAVEGRPLVTAMLAVSRGERTDFFHLEAWDKNAAILSSWVHKGHMVGIRGHLRQNRWTDPQSGHFCSSISVVVDSLTLIGSTSPSAEAEEKAIPKPPSQEAKEYAMEF